MHGMLCLRMKSPSSNKSQRRYTEIFVRKQHPRSQRLLWSSQLCHLSINPLQRRKVAEIIEDLLNHLESRASVLASNRMEGRQTTVMTRDIQPKRSDADAGECDDLFLIFCCCCCYCLAAGLGWHDLEQKPIVLQTTLLKHKSGDQNLQTE